MGDAVRSVTLRGRYEVGPLLGRGATARVHRGRDLHTGRTVALKLFELADGSNIPDALARFRAEAALLARVRSPHVVDVIDAGEECGVPFLVMEFLEGQDLHTWLERHAPLAPVRARRLTLQIAVGLAAIHEIGVVHRDLKPENVLMSADGRPCITDLGLALAPGTRERRTRSGLVLGSPGFIAPEVLVGEKATPAADVFALGMMLYQFHAGELPFSGTQMSAILRESLGGIPEERFRRLPKIDAGLARAMLAPEPADRPTIARVSEVLADALMRARGSSEDIPTRLPDAGAPARGAPTRRISVPVPPPATPARFRRPRRGLAAGLLVVAAALVGLAGSPAPDPGRLAGPEGEFLAAHVGCAPEAPARPAPTPTELISDLESLSVHGVILATMRRYPDRRFVEVTSKVDHGRRPGDHAVFRQELRDAPWFAALRALLAREPAALWGEVRDLGLRRRLVAALQEVRRLATVDRLLEGDGEILPGVEALLAPMVEITELPAHAGHADRLPGDRVLLDSCEYLTTLPASDSVAFQLFRVANPSSVLTRGDYCGSRRVSDVHPARTFPLLPTEGKAPGALEVTVGFWADERRSTLEVEVLGRGGAVLAAVPLAFPHLEARFKRPHPTWPFQWGSPLPVTLRFAPELLAGEASAIRLRASSPASADDPSERATAVAAGMTVAVRPPLS